MIYLYTESLAWDWINEKLYWTDSHLTRIEVYDPNTDHRKLLFGSDSFTSSSPSDIVLDPNNGFVL